MITVVIITLSLKLCVCVFLTVIKAVAASHCQALLRVPQMYLPTKPSQQPCGSTQ